MTAATVAEGEAPRAPGFTPGMMQAGVLIVVGILATTLAQPMVLSSLPIRNMLKNELHVTRSDMSAFVFWTGLAFYLKPIVGIVTDAFPLFGSRRRNYLMVAATISALGWVVMWLTPHQYGALLRIAILINCFMVVSSTLVGGFLVEIAQGSGSSGRLTALREATQRVCAIINGPVSGYLATIAFGWTAGISGMVAFLLVPAAYFLIRREQDAPRAASSEVLGAVGFQLQNIFTAPTLWAAAGLSLLVFIAPGFGTALFYAQQNQLHMTTNSGPGLPGFLGGQGFLGVIGGSTGLLATAVYAWACRRYNLRTLLAVCLAVGSVVTLGYLHYTSAWDARLMAGLDGFAGILGEIALMDLAVRATPKGSEGLGYAIMISVRNVAIFGTDWLGSQMLDKLHWPFAWLVLSNAATTLIAVPLVFLLPAVLVRNRDAEIFESTPEPETQLQD